jgi:16S rRNA (cytidine1402-2'-O)-methyltransferase
MSDTEPARARQPVTVRFHGHAGLQATDMRVLEFLEADEWVNRAGILGLRTAYDPAAITALRGRFAATLHVGEWVDRFEGTVAPHYHRSTPLVFRRDTKSDKKTFAWQCSKAAGDIDRRLVEALRAPDAIGVLTLEPVAGTEIPLGTLTVLSMPIGNQADLPPRALDVLMSADLILAEDTREAARALRWRGVTTPIVSCHEQNERANVPKILARLAKGERLALISDAGTPLISDPGFLLIQAAVETGVSVTAVPGPSAVLMAVIVAGLSTATFRFAGFVPRKPKDSQRFLEHLLRSEDTTVFFESAHRLKRTLTALSALAPQRLAALCRDLTKRTEEILRGSCESIAARIVSRDVIRGEYTLVLSAAPPAAENAIPVCSQPTIIEAFVQALLQENCPTPPIVRAWQRLEPISRNEAYARTQSIANTLKSIRKP